MSPEERAGRSSPTSDGEERELGNPAIEYERRLTARRAAHAAVDRVHARLGMVRVAAFLALLAVAYASLFRDGASAGWLALPALALVLLGWRMRACERERQRLARAIELYERSLARLRGAWARQGTRGGRFEYPDHLYARDLDLFGEGSLFQLLCAARTGIGRATLASWLLAPAEPEPVRERQAAVAELASELDFREDLAVLGEDAAAEIHPDALIAWGEREASLGGRGLQLIARALGAIGAIAFFGLFAWLAAALGLVELPAGAFAALPPVVLTVGVAHGLVAWRFRDRTSPVLHGAEVAAPELDLLAALLGRIERREPRAALLARLRDRLDTAGQPPSRRIARLDDLMSLVDSRHNDIVRLLGVFVLWDLNLALALESWRRASGRGVRHWLEAIGETEALASLARYRYERPEDVFPELVAGGPRFLAEGLGHPLLPAERLVRNDVRLGDAPRVLVVSGSNMSGKSTLLRTVGVSAVLAQAGAPVRARRLSMSPLAVGASIRIVDSLREGTSRFYAEITRLRAIVDRTAESLPVLFLVDEMLHGTNSHDRRTGAAAIVRGLLDRGAIGLLTTHDLALTEIADELGEQSANVHFADELIDGKLRFEYRLRDGVVRKSNAIELMRSIGLEV